MIKVTLWRHSLSAISTTTSPVGEIWLSGFAIKLVLSFIAQCNLFQRRNCIRQYVRERGCFSYGCSSWSTRFEFECDASGNSTSLFFSCEEVAPGSPGRQRRKIYQRLHRKVPANSARIRSVDRACCSTSQSRGRCAAGRGDEQSPEGIVSEILPESRVEASLRRPPLAGPCCPNRWIQCSHRCCWRRKLCLLRVVHRPRNGIRTKSAMARRMRFGIICGSARLGMVDQRRRSLPGRLERRTHNYRCCGSFTLSHRRAGRRLHIEVEIRS